MAILVFKNNLDLYFSNVFQHACMCWNTILDASLEFHESDMKLIMYFIKVTVSFCCERKKKILHLDERYILSRAGLNN